MDGEEGQLWRVYHPKGDHHSVAIFRLGCGRGIILAIGEGLQILARDDTRNDMFMHKMKIRDPKILPYSGIMWSRMSRYFYFLVLEGSSFIS
jgi:hypothetical protein